MKKVLMVLISLAIIITGCGAPKTEVPKARESEGTLLQSTYSIFVTDSAFRYLEDRSLMFLTDSYDIDQVGSKTGGVSIASALFKTFPENQTLATFFKYLSNSNLNDSDFVKAVHDKSDELWNQTKAVFSFSEGDNKKFNEDQSYFVNYCSLTAIKAIIDDKEFDKIARSNQGKEFESVDNRKALMSRTYRAMIADLYQWGGDDVAKAKLDVMIKDACSESGNSIYYDDIVNFIMNKYKEMKDLVIEGPYRDFVK